MSTDVSLSDDLTITPPTLTWGIFLSIMCLTGTLLNLYVITLSCISHRYNRRPLSILILSQSAADLLSSLCLLLAACELLLRDIDAFRKGTVLRKVFCLNILQITVLYYVANVSNWSHLATSYNRYCLCFKAMERYNEIFSVNHSKAFIFGIWFVPAMMSIAVALVMVIYDPNGLAFDCQSFIQFVLQIPAPLCLVFVMFDYSCWVANFIFLFKVYRALPDCNLTRNSKRWTKWTVFSTAFRGTISLPYLVGIILTLLRQPGLRDIPLIFLQVRMCGAVISPIPYAFCLKEYSDGLRRFRSRSNPEGQNDRENEPDLNELDFNLSDLLARLEEERARIENGQVENAM